MIGERLFSAIKKARPWVIWAACALVIFTSIDNFNISNHLWVNFLYFLYTAILAAAVYILSIILCGRLFSKSNHLPFIAGTIGFISVIIIAGFNIYIIEPQIKSFLAEKTNHTKPEMLTK